MKEYKKPEIRSVALADSLMGDGNFNIGFASKPDNTEGELPTSAKENILEGENGSHKNTQSDVWDE